MSRLARILKFARLPALQRRLLASVTIWLLLIRIGLWFLPFALVKRWALKPNRRGELSSYQPAQIAWAISLAQRLVPHATCLVQALTAQRLLQQSGRISQMHIGVAKDQNGEFTAHAWVECEGKVVVGDTNLDSYTRLLSQ